MTRYKWDRPHDWLDQYLAKLNPHESRALVRHLAMRLDADDVEEVFQDDMDADGYFDDQDAEPVVDEDEDTEDNA